MRQRVELLTASGTGVQGLAVVQVSFLSQDQIPLEPRFMRTVGVGLVAKGILLALWAGLHLRGAIMGFISPTEEHVVTSGPYRFVRHPVYPGMTIAMLGVALTLGSWIAILVTILGLLPAELYQARLEERALKARFGSEWEAYGRRTPFFPAVSQ